MAQEGLWKRGSRRRMGQIRWKRREIIHAIVLTILMIGFSFWVGVWIATHHFE